METQTNTQTLSEIIGMNAREIRLWTGASLERLSFAARAHGLNWSTGRVGDLESGRVQATLPTLFALAASLSQLSGRPITFKELLRPNDWRGSVEVNEKFVIAQDDFVAMLGTGSVWADREEEIETAEQHMANATATDLVRALGWPNKEDAIRDLNLPDEEKLVEVLVAVDKATLADRRAAKTLGVSLPELMIAALRRWGKPLSDRREELAGTDSTNQHRGQITRDLYAALRVELGQAD